LVVIQNQTQGGFLVSPNLFLKTVKSTGELTTVTPVRNWRQQTTKVRQMKIESKTLENKVTEALDPEVRDLLHSCYTEDHEEIDLVYFSDDEGTTKIVFETNRKDTIQVLAPLNASDFRDGLTAARATGQRVMPWRKLDM
jgi:hypothetical protein